MIVKSQSPEVTIPEMPITDYVLRRAERLGDKPALVDGPTGRTLTYRQLADGVRRVAAGLAQRGFKKGDVLAIYSPNLPEYALAMLGGGLARRHRHHRQSALHARRARQAARGLEGQAPRDGAAVPGEGGGRRRRRPAASRTSSSSATAAGARPFAELMQHGDRPPAVTIDPRNDVVVLPYSSGTTGLPKGVMLTHYNLVANLCQCEGMRNFDGFGEADVTIAVLPFFHIYGMVVIMMLGLANGGTVVVMPRFDLQEFLELVQKHRVTILPLVPPIVLGLVKHPLVAKYDLSSVRLVFSGAAPLGEDMARELSRQARLPRGAGLRDDGGEPRHPLSPTSREPKKPGSAGKVVPNTEVKLVDVVSGEAVAQGAEGELWIRGPQIMKGYLGRPEETADCLDGEGWYHTGDVGYVDADGFFFIVDRTKELIKYKGLQVAPAELEALLVTHPAVLDAAVVRRADEEAGEVPKAYVVLKGDDASRATTADAIMGWVAGRVAPHKRIRHLEFIDQIPKSASGKILRRVLIDRDRV